MTTASLDFADHNQAHQPVSFPKEPDNLHLYANELYQMLKEYQVMIGTGQVPDLDFKLRVQSLLAIVEGIN